MKDLLKGLGHFWTHRSFWGWIIGVGILYRFFYGTIKRRLKINRERNLDIAIRKKLRKDVSLVFVSNHEGLVEALLLPLLLFPRFLTLHSLIPVSTPDEDNFMEAKIVTGTSIKSRIFAWLLKKFMKVVPAVPIPRKSPVGSGKAFLKIRDMLDREKGAVFVLFAEGGRTSSEMDPANLRTQDGKTIRHFQSGIAKLIEKTKRPFIICPVWGEGASRLLSRDGSFQSDEKLFFHFGRPFMSSTLSNLGQDETLQYLENAVLSAKNKPAT